jgi:hypothetical protein
MPFTFQGGQIKMPKGASSEYRNHLGHAHVSDTYWYLQTTPKLLGDIATAAEALYRGDER